MDAVKKERNYLWCALFDFSSAIVFFPLCYYSASMNDYSNEIMLQKACAIGDVNAPVEMPPKPSLPKKLGAQRKFNFTSDFKPAGDQPQAIKALVAGLKKNERDQVLLGVTGSGKTFTMAQIIHKTGRPAIILAPNKILAAQLYGEFCEFFPDNAVEYFVSYYDYYQPEAYVAKTDTYIEKESSLNEQIDRMRHAATRSLLEREDVIVVASVSCIYGIGSPTFYAQMSFVIDQGQVFSREDLIKKLVALHYKRNDLDFTRGCFRVNGDAVDIFPSHYEDRAWRIEMFGDEIETLAEFDPLTGKLNSKLDAIRIYPNSHYVTPGPTLHQALDAMRGDLTLRVRELTKANKLLEAQRLEQRTSFDIEMIQSTGSCAGIENYSRYLTGRKQGQPPPTLFEYLPDNVLVFMDESHVTVSQLGAMFRGDFQRKRTLVEYGFRLPACMDNRPLRFEEWNSIRAQTIYVSATPSEKFELKQTQGVFVDQVIRPTGLLDPEIIIRPAKNQVDDLIDECLTLAKKKQRALVTTLTKRMAEDLSEYMHEQGIRVRYMHSDISTLERIEIIHDLRMGEFDVLVGINLLREGLDIPECTLVAILDADKEGFLRSKTSLIQTVGRAARNVDGRAILYADKITASIQHTIDETERRREKQLAYNKKHNITPQTIKKNINDIMKNMSKATEKKEKEIINLKGGNLEKSLAVLQKEMKRAADELEFEEAGRLRDEIHHLEKMRLTLGDGGNIDTFSFTEKTQPKAGLPGTRTRNSKASVR